MYTKSLADDVALLMTTTNPTSEAKNSKICFCTVYGSYSFLNSTVYYFSDHGSVAICGGSAVGYQNT